MGLAVKRQLEFAGGVFDHVGPGKAHRWELQRVALHFFLVRRKLAQLVVTPFPFLRRLGAREARSNRVDQTRHALERFLQPVALELPHELLGRVAGDDFDFRVGRLVCDVALRVIPVEMAVYQVTHGLVRDFPLDLREQRSGCRGLGVGIHH